MTDDIHSLYRQIPSVHEVLAREDVQPLAEGHSQQAVTRAVRWVLKGLREEVRAQTLNDAGLRATTGELGARVRRALEQHRQPRLRRVVNATGVLLQTNLGRAPLAEAAIQQIMEVARGYSNLEFDLETGERSRRDVHVASALLQVAGLEQTGTYAAAVVNNCAAATLLALNTLAEGGEVVVSRGELVEIGGGFRIPEVLAKSGAVLREVGTTNKTRISDYAAALGPATRLILRVHRSNFRIEGFTEQPSLAELVELGRQSGVPVFDDQGTGCVVDLDAFGLKGESSWKASVGSGATLVAASGDKLFGGPQCGLLLGEREVVERVQANPLFRALRVDKLTYAALEATLLAYLSGEPERIPVIGMMRLPSEAVRVRCVRWAETLATEHVQAEVVETRSVVGGGTTPGASLPSYAVALRHTALSEKGLAALLRGLATPVVGRLSEGRVLLDLRTVPEAEDGPLLDLLRAALSAGTRADDGADEGS